MIVTYRSNGQEVVPFYVTADKYGIALAPTNDLKFVAGKLHQRFTYVDTGYTAGWYPVTSE